jgi:hypothetical protein
VSAPFEENPEMHVSTAAVAALAAFSLFASSARSQIQVFGGPEDDRRCATVIMFGENVMGGCSLSYSAPDWKAEYDKPGALDPYRGQNVRLGKNWWTTFETSVPVEIGGTKLMPGAYVLGLHYTEDGEFHLLAIDAGMAMKKGMMPFSPQGWSGGTAMPLTLEKDSLDETHQKMEISISANQDDPSKGAFAIRWGKHQLTADVAFQIHGDKKADKARDASMKKTDKKMEKADK